jgi:transcriptional regulator with GAF, ATPase, and Fis domain
MREVSWQGLSFSLAYHLPMQKFQGLLLSVWQEACRHIELREATAAIARMVATRLPLATLLVREVDVARSRLASVALGLADDGATQETTASMAPTPCSPAEMSRLLAWGQAGAIGHRRDGGTAEEEEDGWAPSVPRHLAGEALVGALTSGGTMRGVLVIVARPGVRFAPRHASLARALLEPFSVALENHHRLRELQALREAAEAEKRSLLTRLGRTEGADTIVGAEAGLRPVMERVELVARADVPVLILGETGAGKEVIARAIHLRSARAGAFIRVNCGAIPPDLIDSQLFGHERGSFTGAVDTRKGWFERADGGTLFLDEIGELPPAAQVRLLRVLQDGSVERIGAQETLKVDTRIVAATHRDLTVMIRAGRFREDLWYRIAVFPVLLPPLRERREDIPALARHFVQRAAVRFGLPVRMPSARDMATLVDYPWPGNTRELAAVIDRAVILGEGERLEVAKALGVPTTSGTDAPAPPDARAASTDPGAGVEALDTVIRRHIESVVAGAGGRIEGARGAAALLRVNPHTLRAMMRKLGIDWSRFRSRG